jgi:hypothetical protein
MTFLRALARTFWRGLEAFVIVVAMFTLVVWSIVAAIGLFSFARWFIPTLVISFLIACVVIGALEDS